MINVATQAEIRKAHDWASALADDDEWNHDRSMILEGLLKMVYAISNGQPVDFVAHTLRWTRMTPDEATAAMAELGLTG